MEPGHRALPIQQKALHQEKFTLGHSVLSPEDTPVVGYVKRADCDLSQESASVLSAQRYESQGNQQYNSWEDLGSKCVLFNSCNNFHVWKYGSFLANNVQWTAEVYSTVVLLDSLSL